jgi:dephospho-CoA kinase
MKVIAITGMPGAGKDVVSDIIIKEKKIPMLTMRSVVESEMKEKGIELNNKNLREYATDLREKYGNNIVAKKMSAYFKKL